MKPVKLYSHGGFYWENTHKGDHLHSVFISVTFSFKFQLVIFFFFAQLKNKKK